MAKRQISRRQFVGTAAAATSLVAAPFVRTAGAAGSLSLALWDHWVPGGNTAMTEICQAWADKEKVNPKVDSDDVLVAGTDIGVGQQAGSLPPRRMMNLP